MIEIFLSSPDEVKDAQSRMDMAIANLPKDFFYDAVAAGKCACSNIALDGKTLYRVFWQKIAGDTMDVLGLAFVGIVPNPKVWQMGLDRIARDNGCSKMIFATAVKGLVRTFEGWGAKVSGVTMRRDVPILRPLISTATLVRPYADSRQ